MLRLRWNNEFYRSIVCQRCYWKMFNPLTFLHSCHGSSINMRRLPQFVRLCLASVSRLARLVSRLCASRVCVRLASVCVRLASVRLSRVCLRLCACVSRLCACVSRLSVCLASVCVCLASASRVCVRASVSRLRLASVCVCLSRVKGSECVRLSRVCLSVSRLSLLVNACGVWLILCRSSFKRV